MELWITGFGQIGAKASSLVGKFPAVPLPPALAPAIRAEDSGKGGEVEEEGRSVEREGDKSKAPCERVGEQASEGAWSALPCRSCGYSAMTTKVHLVMRRQRKSNSFTRPRNGTDAF